MTRYDRPDEHQTSVDAQIGWLFFSGGGVFDLVFLLAFS